MAAPELSPRHAKCVELLALGESTAEVAAQLGVNARTVRKWRQRPEVRAALREAAAELRAVGLRRLSSLLGQAVDTLGAVLADGAAAPSARVSGAKAVLDATLEIDKRAAMEELEDRLCAVEERLRGDHGT